MPQQPARSIMQSPPGAEVLIDGQRFIYFGGTSYLGLAQRPEVIEAACAAAREFGVHTATSRSGFGTNPVTLRVERLAAEFFGAEESFYFATGYAGSHILAEALASRCDFVLADASAHYCLIDAARLIGKPVTRYRHLDSADLEEQLRRLAVEGRRPLVLSDGVFALTGGLAPIKTYLEILGRFETATLLVDDAHGFGALGRSGRGTLEHFGVWGPAANAAVAEKGVGLYVCGTLSKAMGGYGGIIPGSAALVEAARSASPYYNGASAPAAPVAGASVRAIEIALDEPELRERLRRNTDYARAGLRRLGLAIADSPAPIIAVVAGDSANMRRVHDSLRARGFIVPYIASYSGSGSEGVLRVAIFATHTTEMIDSLLSEMARAL